MRLATRPRGLAALASGAAAVAVGLAAGGCDIKSFIDPTEMFPNVKTPLQKPVLTSLSALDPSIDDPTDEFYNAQEIQPQDNLVVSRDYRIGKGDLINVSVSNLVEQNLETVRQSTVSESGNINLPLIATPVKAEGLTESELQRAVSDAYRNANILSNAQVSVQVLEARARSFNVLGAVQAPGQYIIFKADFRVLDALVLAHDVLQSVDTIYVIRQVKEDPNTMPPEAPSSPGGGGGPAVVPTPPGVDPLAPRGDAGPAPGGVMTLMQTPATDATAATTAPVAPALTPATPTPAAPAAAAPAPAGPPAAAAAAPTPSPSAIPPSPEAVPAPAAPVPAPAFQFAAPQAPSATRTIRVPLTALRSGALEYNIVIRPGDLIMVPQPVVGEYYMGGHVLRVGVYSLSARKITIKQAIISAGMLDGVGIPQRTEIYRRIGAAREALVRVDVDAIFSGDQPDIYLKPNDVVMTGTNLLAPFIAAVRQGFRITYGFGFLYDRNFAPAQQGT
jgi:polysaccharide export outer membrane protein